MATERRMQFVHWQLVWMLGSILVLVVFDALSLESVFICSLIGLLIITELTAPFAVEPSWRKRLPWLVIAGWSGLPSLSAAGSLHFSHRRWLDYERPTRPRSQRICHGCAY